MAETVPPGDPAPSDQPAPEATPPPADDLGDPGKKALDEERKARRDAERKLRDQAKELEELRQQSMSDQEKAVAQARTEGRSEGIKEASVKVAAATLRATAAGRFDVTDDFLAGVNLASFVDDAGDVDEAKVAKFVDGIAPVREEAPTGFPDLGQGARGGGGGGSKDPLLDTVKQIAGVR